MACNRKMAYRYNNYITKKKIYIKIPIGVEVVELSK